MRASVVMLSSGVPVSLVRRTIDMTGAALLARLPEPDPLPVPEPLPDIEPEPVVLPEPVAEPLPLVAAPDPLPLAEVVPPPDEVPEPLVVPEPVLPEPLVPELTVEPEPLPMAEPDPLAVPLPLPEVVTPLPDVEPEPEPANGTIGVWARGMALTEILNLVQGVVCGVPKLRVALTPQVWPPNGATVLMVKDIEPVTDWVWSTTPSLLRSSSSV